ncbi:EamA family transporter [Chelativorans sp. ZYF759]|uniref:DMT family transporter n=1 Tax=Chelativorans sp. ZYF759 TaxID=2692213 RepID=UPI00145DCCE7|nr:DMT family transporter [Chelativorans sp. ZYF759]NMG41604.1 EamA family transporter [Chelativorans sp. ZYF759]
MLLVFVAAVAWSLGGTIARFISISDPWTVIFWRSIWAALFLIGFMLWRDGLRGMVAMFRAMGMAGVAVGLCFALASTTFILALGHTTVANILLIYAAAPLFAALFARLLFGERVSASTWAAIAAVFFGIGVMMSESLDPDVSPVGGLLALVGPICFALAAVLTRRHAHVRMTPATMLGTLFAGTFAATQASGFLVGQTDMALLFAFGAINLGLGLACFATGARLIPAALAALLATFETLLGPVWVWLIHAEIPSVRTIIGGSIVFAALILHILLEFRRHRRRMRPGELPVPH